MEIRYKPKVIKQLKKLPVSEKKKIVRKLELLQKNPYSGKTLEGEFKNFLSLRAWPYRIIYKLQKKQIIVQSIKHRQSVYKS